MPSTERRIRRIDIKLPPSGGGSTADTATTEPVPPSIPAPAAPSGLTVVSTALLYSAVSPQALANLSWYAPPGLTPDAYVIQWALDSGFTSPTTRPTSGAATTAGVDGLPVGTAVYFRVAAVVRGVAGAWSNTASTTTPSDTTPPAAPTSFGYTWSGLTGDLTITWTNPTSANFRDVRVRIYTHNGGTLLRDVYAAGGLYVWTLGQHHADTSGVYDPSVYVVLTARSWSGVFSATDLTGSPTLAAPATPSGLTHSWATDDGTAGADLLVTWTRSDSVAAYELTLNSTARLLGNTDRYLFTFDQNAAENAGTADPSVLVSLKARDALGQTSAVPTFTTAINSAPPAMSTPTAFAGTSTVGLTITPSAARDLLDYRIRVYKSAVLVDTIYTPDAQPTITISDGSGSYTFDIAARDMFSQIGTASSPTSAVSLIDWDTFVTGLRAGLVYSDSLGSDPTATLAALKDGDRTTNVITYPSGATWKWTQGDWGTEITHRNQEFAPFGNCTVYLATSVDGTTWTYFYGGTPTADRTWTATSSTATEATAQAGAVLIDPGSGIWKFSLPAPRVARYIRIYHRNTTGSYIFREWFPATYFTATHIESESLTSREILVGSLTGDRLAATAIDGFVITGATIQTAASGERVVLDSTGLKTYDSAGVVQVEATTATDGKLTAGAGIVTLDASGIQVATAITSTTNTTNAYRFTNSGSVVGTLAATVNSGDRTLQLSNERTAGQHQIFITARTNSGGSADVRLTGDNAALDPEDVPYIRIAANDDDSSTVAVIHAKSLLVSNGTSDSTSRLFVGNTGVSVASTLTVGDWAPTTWTPVLQGTGTAGTFTYTRRVARRTLLSKNVVMCQFEIVVGSVSVSATGNLVMTGLPFTAKNTTNYQQSGYLSQWDLLNLTASDYVPGINIQPNTTTVAFVQSGDNVASAAVPASTVVGGFFVRGAIIYEIEI